MLASNTSWYLPWKRWRSNPESLTCTHPTTCQCHWQQSWEPQEVLPAENPANHTPATRSDSWTSGNNAPATKSDTWISPNNAHATKSDSELHHTTWLYYYLTELLLDRLLDSTITWLFYYLTLLVLDSTITLLYYYLTVLLLGSTITLLYYYLTLRLLASTITWLYYDLTLLLLDSTMTWLYYYLTLLLPDSSITWRHDYLTPPVLVSAIKLDSTILCSAISFVYRKFLKQSSLENMSLTTSKYRYIQINIGWFQYGIVVRFPNLQENHYITNNSKCMCKKQYVKINIYNPENFKCTCIYIYIQKTYIHISLSIKKI